jgi:outer membrane murein-binding lipoprotein Lpp
MSMFALAIVFAQVLEDYQVYSAHAKKLNAKIDELENKIQQLNKQDNCELLIKSHAQAFKQLQVVLNKRIIIQDNKLKKMDKEWKKYI